MEGDKMNSFLKISLVAILLVSCLFAQAPDTLWTKTFGGEGWDVGNSVQQTKDGGYIIVGHKDFGAGDNDVWLIKTDPSGDTLWTKTFGGEVWDHGYLVEQTTDGGYIMVGHTDSFGAGDNDVWLIKTDSSGDTLWTKTFGGEGRDYGYSVQQTSDGGYIMVGSTELFGSRDDDVWFIKTDESGDTLWTKTYGWGFYDVGESVQQTTDGGYIITGSKNSGNQDVLLIKTDASGDTLWTRTYGRYSEDYGTSVQQTSDGGYILTGGSGFWIFREYQIWLIKTDSTGDTLWTKTFGGEGWNSGSSVQQTKDGGYIIVGYTESLGSDDKDVWIIKTDSSGDTLWTKTFGGEGWDSGNSVQQTADGGYIIVGETGSDYSTLYSGDVWLIKLAADPTVHINVDQNWLSANYKLYQNYPNPFNPSTTIEFDLPKASDIRIEVYKITGQKVQTLLNEKLSVGNHKVEFNAQNLSSGVYFYRIEAGEYEEVRKMILLK
jgi:hypothetical protein